jgi:hypothetical protein
MRLATLIARPPGARLIDLAGQLERTVQLRAAPGLCDSCRRRYQRAGASRADSCLPTQRPRRRSAEGVIRDRDRATLRWLRPSASGCLQPWPVAWKGEALGATHPRGSSCPIRRCAWRERPAVRRWALVWRAEVPAESPLVPAVRSPNRRRRMEARCRCGQPHLVRQ